MMSEEPSSLKMMSEEPSSPSSAPVSTPTTAVYTIGRDVNGESGRGADYGFAAAIAVLIFVMVAGISAYSFRYTRSLEEIA